MRASSPLQTVDHALAVLEHLAAARSPQPLTRLARDFGISKSSMYRVLATLEARGFVVQDVDTQHYGFGPSCARLVDQSRIGATLSALCLPVLHDLWHETGETILLGVCHRGQAVVVERISSPRPVAVQSTLGAALPLHAVSTGKVLLAGRPDAEIERLLPTLERFTPATIVEPEAVRAEVARVRRAGYAVNREGYRVGVSGVAAPVVWPATGATAAAIGVCAPAARFEEAFPTLRDLVVAAAAAASGALAGDAPAAVRSAV